MALFSHPIHLLEFYFVSWAYVYAPISHVFIPPGTVWRWGRFVVFVWCPVSLDGWMRWGGMGGVKIEPGWESTCLPFAHPPPNPFCSLCWMDGWMEEFFWDFEPLSLFQVCLFISLRKETERVCVRHAHIHHRWKDRDIEGSMARTSIDLLSHKQKHNTKKEEREQLGRFYCFLTDRVTD